MFGVLDLGCVDLVAWYEGPSFRVPLHGEEFVYLVGRLQVVDSAVLKQSSGQRRAAKTTPLFLLFVDRFFLRHVRIDRQDVSGTGHTAKKAQLMPMF